MSDARVVAWLKDGERNQPLMTVGPGARAIVLDIPAGVELRGASLTLQAPGDDVTLEFIKGVGTTLVTSNNKNQLPEAEGLTWFSLDWGTRRPLRSLKITATSDAVNRGRLSVAEGGPWYPAAPFDTFVLNGQEQALPGVTGSRLLVEIVKGPLDPAKPKELSTAVVSDVVLKVAARPADLSASLEPGTLFFHQALPMQPLEELTLGDSLRSALQRAWPAGLKGGRVTLLLRSSVPGKLIRLTLTLDTATLVQTWGGGAEFVSLPLDTDGERACAIDVASARELREVRFRVRHRLREEQLPLAPRLSAFPSLAHQCGSGFAAAQSFSLPLGSGPLVGLDLHLRPLTRTFKGTLTLFPDVYDRPGDAPWKGACLALALEEKGDPPWPARWVSLDLLRPGVLPAARWWAVLTGSEGEVLWTLDRSEAAPPSGALVPLTALHRSGDAGPWLPWMESSWGGPPAALWALTRPRLKPPAAEPPAAPRVMLRWGARTLLVTPDETGLVSLDERALADFTLPAASPPSPLEVVIQSRIAGDCSLSELRVASPRTESFTLFPLK